jgi:hypothetical protein
MLVDAAWVAGVIIAVGGSVVGYYVRQNGKRHDSHSTKLAEVKQVTSEHAVKLGELKVQSNNIERTGVDINTKVDRITDLLLKGDR